MAVLPVLQFPDPRLKEPSRWIRDRCFDYLTLVDDLIETMNHFPGCVGLAAPQVGYLVRLVVLDTGRYRKKTQSHGMIVLIDPVIRDVQHPQICREGCLSVPDYTGNVARYQQITVEGVNEKGERTFISTHGFEAVVIQHELDHLDGTLFLDRVCSLKTDIFRRKNYLHS